jgi:hypothetical protein
VNTATLSHRDLALKNADVRAERLGCIAFGGVYQAQKEAIEGLGKAGAVALPEILQVMDRPPGRYDGDALRPQEKTAGGNCMLGCSKT